MNVSFEEPVIIDAYVLLLKISKETCILGIYRPPSLYNISNFVNSLVFVLNKINAEANQTPKVEVE